MSKYAGIIGRREQRLIAEHVTSWCYICATSHPWDKACPPVPKYKVSSRYAVSR